MHRLRVLRLSHRGRGDPRRADVSITVCLDPKVKAAIADIGDDAWTTIEYTDAVYDETSQQWVSRAEVAEIGFTAFTSRKAAEQVAGRLVVRRIPDLNPSPGDGQQSLFDTWRFHPFFTTTDLDTATADKTHRRHAIIEAVHADLKDSALAHLPSGRINANAAWVVLAVIAFNLTRAAATLTGPALAKCRTATIRRTLITVPARIASSARRLTLHLPRGWPWETAWNTLQQHVSPTSAAHRLTAHPTDPRNDNPQEQPDSEIRGPSTPTQHHNPAPRRTIEINTTPTADRWIEA